MIRQTERVGDTGAVQSSNANYSSASTNIPRGTSDTTPDDGGERGERGQGGPRLGHE